MRRIAGLLRKAFITDHVRQWELLAVLVLLAIGGSLQQAHYEKRIDGLEHEVSELYAVVDLASSRPVVKIVERIGGVTRVVRVCDGDSVLKALNEVKNSQARSGEGGLSNAASGRVGASPSHGELPTGSAHASGDNASALTQTAVASSGDAILGQVFDLVNLCGSQVVNATNQVSDSKAVTGDAEAENEADVGVGGAQVVSASPTPEPVSGQEAEPTPLARTEPPVPTGSPSPSPGALPSP